MDFGSRCSSALIQKVGGQTLHWSALWSNELKGKASLLLMEDKHSQERLFTTWQTNRCPYYWLITYLKNMNKIINWPLMKPVATHKSFIKGALLESGNSVYYLWVYYTWVVFLIPYMTVASSKHLIMSHKHSCRADSFMCGHLLLKCEATCSCISLLLLTHCQKLFYSLFSALLPSDSVHFSHSLHVHYHPHLYQYLGKLQMPQRTGFVETQCWCRRFSFTGTRVVWRFSEGALKPRGSQ